MGGADEEARREKTPKPCARSQSTHWGVQSDVYQEYLVTLHLRVVRAIVEGRNYSEETASRIDFRGETLLKSLDAGSVWQSCLTSISTSSVVRTPMIAEHGLEWNERATDEKKQRVDTLHRGPIE